MPTLLQLATRSVCGSNRCLPAGLVHRLGVRQPTMEPDWPGPIPGSDPAGPGGPTGTSLEGSAALLGMLTGHPRLLDQGAQVMLHPDPTTLIPQLAVWPISGNSTEARSFQRKQPPSCSNPGGPRLISLTTHSSGNGIAGVVNGVQIQFQAL